MEQPPPPDSLPKYLAEGLRNRIRRRFERSYVEALIEYREQPVDTDEFPQTAEPVDEPDESGKGTIVEEKVKCGDDSCKCASGNPQDMHGPYLYRYYRDSGTMKSEYVGKPGSEA